MSVRVLVVDDSVVVRRTVADVLGRADDIEVVGTAADGRIGLRRIADLHPDVVTLDVEMPGLDGLQTLAEIRREWPQLPVIMYSTLTERGAHATFEALSLGAVDYATKPSGATTREEAGEMVRANLLPLVRLWGRRRTMVSRRARLANAREVAPGAPTAPAAVPSVPRASTRRVRLVTVGVSTGGPDALATMLPTLPADLSVPVVVVQHMPPVFTAMLAQRLDHLCALQVSEAVDGEQARAGHVYIAPGGQHLEVVRDGQGFLLALSGAEPENSCRPAVDVLFRTASAASGGELLSVVLTGMGHDGLAGARLVRAAGGSVIVQDEDTSVVWGMPGFVAREGLAGEVLPLEEIGPAITRVVRRRAAETGASMSTERQLVERA